MHSRILLRFGMAFALFSSSAFAATGGSEVVLFTPWPFIQARVIKAITATTLADQQTFPALDWQLGEWTPHLTGVHWSLQATMNVTSMTPHAIKLNAKQLLFTISIQRMDLNQVVERVINGTVFRVHVQAECGPIVMTQSVAMADTSLAFQVLPTEVATRVESFNLAWPAKSWNVSAIACTGPQGFDQTFHDELMAELQGPDKVKPWLQGLLATKFQEEANRLMTQVSNPIPVPTAKSPLQLVLTFLRMQSVPEGILNFGSLVWSGNTGETNLTPLVMNAVPAAAAKSEEPIFISPSEGWSALMQAELQSHAPTFNVSMNHIPAFRDLLNSQMQQRVAWPDLLYYSPKSPFTLLLSRPKNYTIHWRPDGTAALESPVTGVVQSVRSGKQWNYVAVQGTVNGRLNVKIDNGQLTIDVKAMNSKFTAAFESAYVAKFQANTTLDDRVLQGFTDYVNQGFHYTGSLPELNVGIAGKATFNGWTGLSKDLIALPMEL